MVERRRQHLEGEAGGGAVHAFLNAGHILVFLQGAGARIGLLQAFAVIDPHLGEQRGVLVPAQARQHGEAGQHLQRRRRAGRRRQLGPRDQLLVDLLLFGHPQAVRHLDDVDAVDEGFVVAVVLEALPLRLVRVGHDDALERDGADILGADVVAFLRRGQQRVQHLDRRLEHLDEFEDALVGAVQAAGVAVGIGIVLRMQLQLADIHLTDQRGDVLVVLVARLGLGDAAIWRNRDGISFCTRNLEMSPSELVQALDAPRAHQPGQAPAAGCRSGLPAARPCCSGSNRPSGLSNTGLRSLPAFST